MQIDQSTRNFVNDPKVQKHRWSILVAVGLFTFMSTLDGSIVNIALPIISKNMDVPMNQVEWVVSIYLMAVCSCLLLFGKIGDSIGKIKVFKIGTLVFVAGSFLCGIPHSLGMLLFARIVQAVGASMTMSTNSGIITEVFPASERGRALGMIGSFVSLGSIAGPGLGGLILAKFSWSYIFWINVPVGLVTIFFGQKVLPKDIIKSGKKIDFTGFVLFALFIICLFGSIFMGQELGFLTLYPLVLFGISFVSAALFYRIETRRERPLVEFKMFKNGLFTLSLITAMMIFVTNFFSNVLMPFFLQNTRNYSASFSGFLMMVFPIVMIVGAPVSGYITDRIGPEILTLVGLLTLCVAQLVYFLLGEHSSLIVFVIASFLMGLGNALFQAPNNTIVMGSVEKKDLGVAGSLNSLARNFGMVVGISLATTVLYSAMSFRFGHKVTTYIKERPDVFIFGMRITYLVAFLICLLATILTAVRFISSRKNRKQTSG